MFLTGLMNFFNDHVNIVEFLVGGVQEEFLWDLKGKVLEMCLCAKQVKNSLIDLGKFLNQVVHFHKSHVPAQIL